MQYLDSLIAQTTPETFTHKIPVLCPASGIRTDRSYIPCALVRAGMWGNVMALSLSGNQLYAPFDCTIEAFPALGYEVQVRSRWGLKLWMKIGIGTDILLAEKCERLVKPKQFVSQGTPLMTIDPRWLKLQQIEPICMIAVKNRDNIKRIVPSHGRQYLAMEDNFFTVYL